MNRLSSTSKELNCFPTEECSYIESSFSISHGAIGIISFILSLGVYLLLFSKSEEVILERLEQEKKSNLGKEKFDILLKAMDENEQKVIRAIKDQDGITQSTLTIRTGLSRSKISEVIKGFESKNLIKRKNKGKTFSIYLTERF